MNWKLKVEKEGKVIQEMECSSGENAKIKAKERRKKFNNVDATLKFYILDSNGRLVFESNDESGQVLRWRWV